MAASSSRNRVYVPDSFVQPKGEHRVTIVWLHDKDGHFFDSVQFVKRLNLKNVKWICPPIVFPNSWYNKGSNIKQYVREALYPTAELVADLFSHEPENGVGGFGLGAAVALHFATNCALGHYPINPRVVVGISGWLSTAGTIKISIESAVGATARAASQSILLTHGKNDGVVPHPCGEEAAVSLREAGFGDVMFVPFARLGPIGHEISLNVMVKNWLEDKLPLDVVHPNEFIP